VEAAPATLQTDTALVLKATDWADPSRRRERCSKGDTLVTETRAHGGNSEVPTGDGPEVRDRKGARLKDVVNLSGRLFKISNHVRHVRIPQPRGLAVVHAGGAHHRGPHDAWCGSRSPRKRRRVVSWQTVTVPRVVGSSSIPGRHHRHPHHLPLPRRPGATQMTVYGIVAAVGVIAVAGACSSCAAAVVRAAPSGPSGR